MQENAQVIEDWKPGWGRDRQQVLQACCRVCRGGVQVARRRWPAGCCIRLCRACRLAAESVLAAGLQGLQVAAVLHAGSAERRPDLESDLEIARTRAWKRMLVSGHKPLRAPMAMLDAEGWSDMTNVLQHCHWGKGIFDNGY